MKPSGKRMISIIKEWMCARHALWMLGRLPYRVPGKCREQCRDREDFVQLVTEHGGQLPGKVANYRIAKFPGTERILFKTNFSKAFKDKAPWR